MATKRNIKATEKKPASKPAKKAKIVKAIVKPKKAIKVNTKVLNHCICIPTSILRHCKNLEQITHVIYQISKAATIFNVGEIVVLDLGDRKDKSEIKEDKTRLSDALLIATLLQYFVTPPYLVKSVFKKQYMGYFAVASKLPRLSALPFMRYYKENENRYREGLAVRMENPNSSSTKEFKQTKNINVGKADLLELKAQLVPTNVRVTVDMIERKVVSPTEAYGDFVGAKSSYGYEVRVAKSFGSVFTESSYPTGYSQCIWVNAGDYFYDETLKEHTKVESNVPRVTKIIKPESNQGDDKESAPVEPANLLMIFGKWDNIKKSFNESKDQFEGCDGAHQFFDGQIELPSASPQGNISIEDSCMISLSVIDSM